MRRLSTANPSETAVDDLQDVELARRTAAGEATAFGCLYHRHRGRAISSARKVVGNADDAEDAVAEAFVRMFRDLTVGRLSPEIPFVAYLLSVTRNAAIDRQRLLARYAEADDDAGVASVAAGPEDLVITRQDVEVALIAVRGLRPRWQMALWLTEVEGIPVRDIGVRMGLSANSTAQLARRARLALRQRHARIAGP